MTDWIKYDILKISLMMLMIFDKAEVWATFALVKEGGRDVFAVFLPSQTQPSSHPHTFTFTDYDSRQVTHPAQ